MQSKRSSGVANHKRGRDARKMMLLYGDAGKGPKVQVLVQDETIWLTQKQIAELFEVQIPAVSKHLKNIFDEKELVKNEVVSKLEITTQHGAIQGKVQTREANFYNLDAIIAVGYRGNRKQATAFRIWATKVLKEYIIKGFALDDARLKQAKTLTGKDYFRELLLMATSSTYRSSWSMKQGA